MYLGRRQPLRSPRGKRNSPNLHRPARQQQRDLKAKRRSHPRPLPQKRTIMRAASVATAETGQTAPMPPSPDKGWGGATLRSRNRTAGWWRSADCGQDLRPKRSRSHLYRSPALAMRPWGGRSIVNAKPAIRWNQARTRLARASQGLSAGRPDRSPITTTRQRSRTRQLSGISRRSTLI